MTSQICLSAVVPLERHATPSRIRSSPHGANNGRRPPRYQARLRQLSSGVGPRYGFMQEVALQETPRLVKRRQPRARSGNVPAARLLKLSCESHFSAHPARYPADPDKRRYMTTLRA